MKWFDRWFKNKVEQSLRADPDEAIGADINWNSLKTARARNQIATAPSTAIPRSISANGVNFNLYRADGGWVVETSYYDDRTDRHDRGLHLITEEQDIGNRLNEIIILQALKR